MSDKKIVTFKKEWRGYAIGETAGFNDEVAGALIESGLARPYVALTDTEKSTVAPAGKKGAAKKAGKPVEPTASVDPIDPIDPVDPVASVDPVDPEELDEKP
ncbi:hypothetical protein DKY63_05705 [Pseudomonas putida]|uniref:Uncharacterized protein n=1 Tax=Pseudomonas putida TaxID=303 RepID=A0A2Z4RFA7_PSEPU|nr:hypothetical protein [Pseudomonas putida]AWY39425.1 hypothetical protein DKY63_05705 [Pseudomonas putida]